MAGKFINTDRKISIDSLVEGFKNNLNNPFYPNLEKAIICTYFNQNLEQSSVEDGTEIVDSYIGPNSPIKYNKINNFHMYGGSKIDIDMDITDWGLESGSDITGTLFILPNTITPKSNDYFIINHINDTVLFKVISTSYDMLDNSNNIWRIEYKLENTDIKTIEKQVVEDYDMMINNVGTDFKAIVKSNDYKFIEEMDNIISKLIRYYITLFYNKRVQTFTYKFDGEYFYDDMMIEFIIRNKIFDDPNNYIYIGHRATLSEDFYIEYDKTFFRFIENFDIDMNPYLFIQGKVIEDRLSLLYMRKEDYFKAIHMNIMYDPNRPMFNSYSLDLLEKIKSNELYSDIDNNNYLNLIIKVINKKDITSEDICNIENIDFKKDISLFYNIPILIYCIEKYLKNMLKRIS